MLDRHTEGRQFGILGDPRVNVLLLNLALDSVAPVRRDTTVARATLGDPK
jgi:hypothetical protein